MPITRNAKKALRVSDRKRVHNIRRKRTMQHAAKTVRDMISGGKTDEAQAALSNAYTAIDKAAKRGIIKANTAARKKSRLSAAILKGKK